MPRRPLTALVLLATAPLALFACSKGEAPKDPPPQPYLPSEEPDAAPRTADAVFTADDLVGLWAMDPETTRAQFEGQDLPAETVEAAIALLAQARFVINADGTAVLTVPNQPDQHGLWRIEGNQLLTQDDPDYTDGAETEDEANKEPEALEIVRTDAGIRLVSHDPDNEFILIPVPDNAP